MGYDSAYKNSSVPNVPILRWVSRLSFLMDEQFRIPGTKYRFGLDPLLNLIPFAGDIVGFAVSGGLVLAMASKGLTSKIVVLMCINILLDTMIGAIPGVGQVWDFFFKSNTRNMRLMEEYYEQGKHRGSGKGTIVLALVILFLIFVVLVSILWVVAAWVISKF
ncbi:DUF4112 domain-containing protein [Pedobacter cryoconitis]|uniref:Uncharacterized protein DUF4112 n=1 Tax=Pedobacter cryoconitis TaxID=188932 RepID=A0A327SYJ0_9SPHI|nr:DUF4112 domain-containing protein [Pedobacter cryoconitis]RAJ32904.1 uncharacterized protein DUF4112 [Pedobacter cryoconitis]